MILRNLFSLTLSCLSFSLVPLLTHAEGPKPAPPALTEKYSARTLQRIAGAASFFGSQYCFLMDAIKEAAQNPNPNSAAAEVMQREAVIYSRICVLPVPADIKKTKFVGFKDQKNLESAVIDYLATYDLAVTATNDWFNIGLITSTDRDSLIGSLNSMKSVNVLRVFLIKDGNLEDEVSLYLKNWMIYTSSLIKFYRG